MFWHLTFVVSVQVPLTCISDRIVGTRSSHFAKLQKVVANFDLSNCSWHTWQYFTCNGDCTCFSVFVLNCNVVILTCQNFHGTLGSYELATVVTHG